MTTIRKQPTRLVASPSIKGMSSQQAALLAQYTRDDEASFCMLSTRDRVCTQSAVVPSGTAGCLAALLATTGASALQAALRRPYLTTEEAAELLSVRPQTLRKAWSQLGAYGSLRPFKVKASRRLYWPTEGIRRMVEEGA